MYELTLTRKAQRFYEQADVSLVERLNRCFDRLRQNPYAHPNIQPLKGSFAGSFRYRVGNGRVVYQVDEHNQSLPFCL